MEEVLEADIILHVRDIAHPETEAQNHDVHQVLEDLGLEVVLEEGMLEALNKVDLLENSDDLPPLSQNTVPLSALTGQGIEDLLALIESRLLAQHQCHTYKLSYTKGAALAWLHQHGEVLEQLEEDEHFLVTARLSGENVNRFKSLFPEMTE